MADGWASSDLSGPRLLTVWEQATGAPPYQQALAILAAAYPGEPPEALSRLGIGERDSRLLSFRERTFGPTLTAVTSCPTCSEQLELEIAVKDIRADFNPDPMEPLTMQAGGWELTFRLPTSRDLAALDGLPPDVDPRGALLERCMLAARQDGAVKQPADLPPEVQAALAECMEQADLQADVQLNLTCPACTAQWRAPYDVVTYLWAEIETWAQALLHEVHVLASVYGWSEGDILAMSARRRRRYLEIIAE